MTNTQFTRLLRQSARAMNKALELKKLVENEYERRYGTNPSDADDDRFIDACSGSAGACNEKITWKDVDQGAVEYVGLEAYKQPRKQT